MIILNGSPHCGGVTDALAKSASGARRRQISIRDHHCAPCAGCNACAAVGACKLAKPPDNTSEIFAAIMDAKALLIVAPIYFYALPGAFKGFIDRCQLYWHFPLRRPSRPAAVILAAGRQRGEQLFTGALLTIKYFLRPLAFQLQDQLCLRGLDNLDSLRRKPHINGEVQDLANKLACAAF